MTSKAKDRFPNYESICLQCGATVYKPVKELTDEEILTIAYEILEVWNTKEALIDFAKAILRKAQEK